MSLLSEVETIAFHAKLKSLTVIERSRNDDWRLKKLTIDNWRFKIKLTTHDSRLPIDDYRLLHFPFYLAIGYWLLVIETKQNLSPDITSLLLTPDPLFLFLIPPWSIWISIDPNTQIYIWIQNQLPYALCIEKLYICGLEKIFVHIASLHLPGLHQRIVPTGQAAPIGGPFQDT